MRTISQEVQAVMSRRELDFSANLAGFKSLAVGFARAARAKRCCENCRQTRAQAAARLDAAMRQVEMRVVPFLTLARPFEVDLARIMTEPRAEHTPATAILTIEELGRVMKRAIGDRSILD